MASHRKDEQKAEVRMELKYCEHCGGLWVREGGAGVYCDKCRSKVEDLPAPKKKPGRVTLPVRKTATAEGYLPVLPGKRIAKVAAAGGAA